MRITILTIIAFFIVQITAAQTSRIAGLETNKEYMELLLQEAQLQKQEDSINLAISSLRETLRQAVDRTGGRETLLKLEGEIFDIRNRIGITAGKINAIEQDYVIQNLDNMTGPREEGKVGVLGGESINPENSSVLVNNDYFRLRLQPADYRQLLRAQSMEATALTLFNQYSENYSALENVHQMYLLAEDQPTADTLYERYNALRGINRETGDSLATTTAFIYDNKAFAYNYILDRLNRNDLLETFEKKGFELRDELANKRGQNDCENISAYILYKDLLLDYETTLASTLSLNSSLDSLVRARNAFRAMRRDFPKIDFRERLFIDYEDISIHTPAKYSTSKPIPQVKLYDKGIIYRILVGSYTRIQQPNIFRGAYPLGYLKGDDNKFYYYAGGFDSYDAALRGVEQLKKAGFRNPEIALWNYGEYSLPEAQPQLSGQTIFRIEINMGGEDLPEEIKNILAENIPHKDISRGGNFFFIGPFETEHEALRINSLLLETIPELDTKIGSSEHTT